MEDCGRLDTSRGGLLFGSSVLASTCLIRLVSGGPGKAVGPSSNNIVHHGARCSVCSSVPQLFGSSVPRGPC